MRISDWSSDVCSSDLPSGERMVLVQPGFRERLIAVLQVQTQVDRLVAVDRELELRAPMSGHAVRYGLGEDIRKRAACTRQHRFRLVDVGELFKRRAIDFETALPPADRAPLAGGTAERRRGEKRVM